MRRPEEKQVWRRNGSALEVVVASCGKGVVTLSSGESLDVHDFVKSWTFVRKSNRRVGGSRCSECGERTTFTSTRDERCKVCQIGHDVAAREASEERDREQRARYAPRIARPSIACPDCGKGVIPASHHHVAEEDRAGLQIEVARRIAARECTDPNCEGWVWTIGSSGRCCGSLWRTILDDYEGDPCVGIRRCENEVNS